VFEFMFFVFKVRNVGSASRTKPYTVVAHLSLVTTDKVEGVQQPQDIERRALNCVIFINQIKQL